MKICVLIEQVPVAPPVAFSHFVPSEHNPAVSHLSNVDPPQHTHLLVGVNAIELKWSLWNEPSPFLQCSWPHHLA